MRAALSIALLALLATTAVADDDVSDLVNGAKNTTTAPAEVQAPATDADHAPARARDAIVVLNDGTQLRGKVWTTLETPLRVWVDETKTYRDVQLAEIKRLDVHILSEAMEDDWRWLKEGSDKKIFSGKKYPNVELAYKMTLANDQTIEGGVVAPIYLLAKDKPYSLALYKKYKGKLDETLKDLVYIRSVEFTSPAEAAASKTTRTLPLIY